MVVHSGDLLRTEQNCSQRLVLDPDTWGEGRGGGGEGGREARREEGRERGGERGTERREGGERSVIEESVQGRGRGKKEKDRQRRQSE